MSTSPAQLAETMLRMNRADRRTIRRLTKDMHVRRVILRKLRKEIRDRELREAEALRLAGHHP